MSKKLMGLKEASKQARKKVPCRSHPFQAKDETQ